jgi:hypothetical protein
MTRYGCITLLILRLRTKSSVERLQAWPESVRLIKDRHFASRHLIEQDSDGETGTCGSLVDIYMSVLIQPNGFYDSKLLHPCENPLPQKCSFRIGRPDDQLRQVICFLSGEADGFGDPFYWLGSTRFPWHDRSPFSTTLG